MSTDKKGAKVTKKKSRSGSDSSPMEEADARAKKSSLVTFSPNLVARESQLAAEDDKSDLSRGSQDLVFANPRFSTRSGQPSLFESSFPTRDSVEFYAARDSAVIRGSRQSRLSENLGQMEVTQNLVSGRFSRAVAEEVAACTISGSGTAGAAKPGRGQQSRQSLRFPDVGRLSLDASSDAEIEDLPELAPPVTDKIAAAKAKPSGKAVKKK